MAEILWMEIGLSCVLAVVLGYLAGKLKGSVIVGGITLTANAITALAITLLPITRLDLLEQPEAIILEVAIWSTVLLGFLGYLLSKVLGTVFLDAFVVPAALVCTYATVFPRVVHEWLAVLGLLVAMALVGTVGIKTFTKFVLRGKGLRPLMVLWFGFCTFCLIGYLVAGRWGVLLIALPTQGFFWSLLYFLSGYTLPLQNDQRAREEEHRKNAFRGLLTFALGTNYPFYVVEDWQTQETKDLERPEPRVPGSTLNKLLAGPGIIINDCNHVTVTTTGFRHRVIPPGLSFTGQFEEAYAMVDLRPQLRACTVKAETKDGIGVSIFAFMPNRVGTGGRNLALGASYPYNRDDVLKAVFQKRTVDHQWARDAGGQASEEITQTPWEELVLIMGPPILKDVILKYTCNELHTPGDPRTAIAGEFRDRLKAKMTPLGIDLIGGGISNIKVPDEVVEQRIRNWEAKWKSQIEIERGKQEAAITRRLESVRTEVQLQMIDTLVKILEQQDISVTGEMLVYQLIDAMSEVEAQELDEQSLSERSLIISARRGR